MYLKDLLHHLTNAFRRRAIILLLVFAATVGISTTTVAQTADDSLIWQINLSSSLLPQQSILASHDDNNGEGFYTIWDDFKDGFTVDNPDAKWFHFAAGPYVGDDGIVTTSDEGLEVVSSGINPNTRKPAFVRTLAQEDDNGFGLPGGIDHVKWLVYMNHISSNGFPGFDAVEGQELVCESWISGHTFGTAFHPFKGVVTNPFDDLRLSSFAMNTIDFDTFMVFDFFLTNQRIYAFYERLPFGRAVHGDYAAFSYSIPVSHRSPIESHHLAIAYNKAAGTVRWLVDDEEVFQVDRIGHLIDREFMTLDHGGTEVEVSPNQLNCGMGMFTLLDAHRPSNIGLVKLSNESGFYFNPEVGEPIAEMFVDDESLESSRLFGQGAKIIVEKYGISSLPVGEGD